MATTTIPGDSKIHPEKGASRKQDDDFVGPVQKRGCTDIICLFGILAFIAGMVYVAVYAHQNNGDYYAFVYGRDSFGNVCNKKNDEISNANYSGQDTTDLDKTFRMNGWLNLITGDPQVIICVDRCPQLPNGTTLSSGTDLKDWYDSTGTSLCRYDVLPQDFSTYYGVDYHCPSDVPTHESILNRCFPSSAVDASLSLVGDVGNTLVESAFSAASLKAECEDAGDVIDNITNDIIRTWRQQLILAAIALGCALLAVILMRWFAAVVIWVLVIGSALGSLAATIYCWIQYKNYHDAHDELNQADTSGNSEDAVSEAETYLKDKKKKWLIIACCVTAGAVIILLVLLVMRKRIALVVQLFHEAGKALVKMPMLLIQPLWTLLALVIFLGVYGLGLLYVETAGFPSADNSTGIVEFEKDNILKYSRWYYIFGILWLIQFCIACQHMVIAGAVAQWYFTWDKSKIGYPILAATKRLIFYHLGTVAFGSLIIAIVQFARLVLSYVESKLRGRAGKLAMYILKILSCCLWCFEKILKFINKNAYIMTAIYGYNFCRAARRGFVLVVENALRVAAINSIGTFCLLLGKLGVTAAVVVIGYQFFFKDNEELCYFWVPVVLCGLVALFVSHCFFTIYGFAIDTIFMCFCEDCSRNDGIEKPYYMSSGLMKFVEDSDKSSNQPPEKSNKQTPPKTVRQVDW